MTQPTLDDRFRDNPPTREAEDTHAWLNAEEQRFILWGLREHWSAARIGRALRVNEATVRRFRKRFWEEPKLLLELGLYEMAGRVRENEYRCLVCGDRVVSRRDTERHLLRHYLDEIIVESVLPKADEDRGENGQQEDEEERPQRRRRRRRN